MSVCQPGNFQYMQLENGTRRFLCLQQNIVVLIWILFFKKDTISTTKIRSELKTNAPKFLVDCFPSSDLVSFFKNNVVALIKFVAYKYQLRKPKSPKSIVSLPLYGQICVPVYKGHKIFDLRREVVIRLFDPDVSLHDISNEIEHMKIASRVSFAPSLRKWDLMKRWYEEDYVIGSVDSPRVSSMDSMAFLKSFFQDLAPHAINLIMLQSPLIKNAAQSVADLIQNIEDTRIGGQPLLNTDEAKIKDFLDRIVDSLQTKKDVPVFHVFTHGDFCPENILKTQQGMKLIDWECAKYRSALYDFYSYFFYRPCHKNLPIETLVFEINEALPFFISKISQELPELAGSISGYESLYRKIYYLERLGYLAEREMTDKKPGIRDLIFRNIEAFDSYEQLLTVKDMGINA